MKDASELVRRLKSDGAGSSSKPCSGTGASKRTRARRWARVRQALLRFEVAEVLTKEEAMLVVAALAAKVAGAGGPRRD